jgi:broad specificity phosphatase PhoE
MVPPTRFVLIRHGEVAEPYQRVFGGRIDMDLSPRGHDQAAVLAKYLRRRPIDALYASPMRRAQLTLAPFADHCPRPAVIRPGLREVDFGDWTGLTWEQVHARHTVSAFRWLEMIEAAAIPNAESGASWRARTEPCVREMLDAHPGQTVAVVCHGGVIRMMVALLLELPLSAMAKFDFEYASLTRIDVHPHKTRVKLLNFVPWRALESQI